MAEHFYYVVGLQKALLGTYAERILMVLSLGEGDRAEWVAEVRCIVEVWRSLFIISYSQCKSCWRMAT